jgi:uncharacterized protein (DUF697 family)
VADVEESREIIRRHVSAAMAVAVTPLPGVDIVGVSAVQVALARRLARRHGVTWDAVRGRTVVIAVVGASLARVGASAVKSLPGAGWIVGSAAQAMLSGASTWALGSVLSEHFGRSGTLDDVDPASMRDRYREALARGRAVARALRRTMRDEPDLGEDAARLARLEGLRRSGALTQEEFERLVDPSDDGPLS